MKQGSNSIRRGATLCVVVSLLAFSSPGSMIAETPDVRSLLDSVLRNAREIDRAAWAGHSFRRHVVRQRLDEDGEVEWRREMFFRVTPTSGGFDEELIEIDGRKPKKAEVAKHRRKGLFAKHYDQTEEIALENPLGEDLPLAPLIFEQEYRFAGDEVIDGIPCHRLEFDARPDPTEEEAQVRLRYAMAGEICIAKEQLRIVAIDLATVREVKAAIRIQEMRLHFQARPVGEVWLPILFELRSKASALGIRFNTHNFYRYGEFDPVD